MTETQQKRIEAMLRIAEHAKTSLHEARTALDGARKVAERAGATTRYSARFTTIEKSIDARDPARPKPAPKPTRRAEPTTRMFAEQMPPGFTPRDFGATFTAGATFTRTSASFRDFDEALRHLFEGGGPFGQQQYRVDPEDAAEQVAKAERAAKEAQRAAVPLLEEAIRLQKVADDADRAARIMQARADQAYARAKEAERVARETRTRYGL